MKCDNWNDVFWHTYNLIQRSMDKGSGGHVSLADNSGPTSDNGDKTRPFVAFVIALYYSDSYKHVAEATARPFHLHLMTEQIRLRNSVLAV